LVHRFDRERFVTTLFAPPERREILLALYAFNVEVARIRENVHDPLAGAIRLQWWREVLTGERPEDEIHRHPIAAPLRRLIQEGAVPTTALAGLLNGREEDFAGEPMPDLAAMERYAAATAANLAEAAVVALGGEGGAAVAAARSTGTAYGLIGLLRAVPFHAALGRITLPADLLAEAGLTGQAIAAGNVPRDRLARVVRPIAARVSALLAEARKTRPAPGTVAAYLPACLAQGHLNRLSRRRWDLFDPVVARPATRPVALAFKAMRRRF
jgi:phytoene synthase